MKRKLSQHLKKITGYQLAKDMGLLPSRIYHIVRTDPSAVIELDADKKPLRIEYSIKRTLESEKC